MYQPTIDVESLIAIDIHVHAGTSAKAPAPQDQGPTRDDTLARITQRSGVGGQTPQQTADYYRERKIACAIWGVDTSGTRPSRPGAVSNDEMIEAAASSTAVFKALEHALGSGWDLLHVDRHLLHDLSGPPALGEIHRRKLPVRNPELTFAVSDHAISSAPGRNTVPSPVIRSSGGVRKSAPSGSAGVAPNDGASSRRSGRPPTTVGRPPASATQAHSISPIGPAPTIATVSPCVTPATPDDWLAWSL